jgi:hypothetical protein
VTKTRTSTLLALAALGPAVLLGVSTGVVPTPWVGRIVPVRAFDVGVWAALSVLTGALAVSYVLARPGRHAERNAGLGSGVLGWFAVSCPVCNKLVVLLFGTSGALHTFRPAQPILGACAVALAAAALAVRVRALRRASCPVPLTPARVPAPHR